MSQTENTKKWALILGVSSGFGAATARACSQAGYNILGVHLDRKSTLAQVAELQAELEKAGSRVIFSNMNAADEGRRKEFLSSFQEKEPKAKISILLHSLAFGSLKPFLAENTGASISKAQVEMTLDVMAHSLVYWAQDIFFRKLFAPQASVFAMTSAGSSRVWKSYGAVSAAKSALESHCRQMALELAPVGVRVNALLAGVTDTAALRKIPGNEEMILAAQKRNPMGRLTTPEDVAKGIVSLAHSDLAFMTGNVIHIDGGENIVE